MIPNPTIIKYFIILLWNANGLKQNEPELLDLLIDKKIDIAFITETHYTTKINNFFFLVLMCIELIIPMEQLTLALPLLFHYKLNTSTYQAYNFPLSKQKIS
jgi:hypothetical protein